MEMVVVTKVTYKYLMNQSKHDLAQMVLDLLKKEEMQNNDLASVCRVSYHVFVDGVCAECGLTMRAADLRQHCGHHAKYLYRLGNGKLICGYCGASR